MARAIDLLVLRVVRRLLFFKYVRQNLFSVVLLQRFRLFLGSSSHFEGKSCFHFVIIYYFFCSKYSTQSKQAKKKNKQTQNEIYRSEVIN